MNEMPDLLAASSLILAILTTLFSTFYNSIDEILNFEPNEFKEDDKSNYLKSKVVMKTKLIPLLITSLFLTAIFIPQGIKLILSSILVLYKYEYNEISYDTILTSYIAIVILMVTLTISIITISKNFYKVMKKINHQRE